VERYRHYDNHRQHLADEFSQIQSKLTLIDDAIAAAHHQMEVAQIPALIPNLEGHAFSLPHTGCRITNQRYHGGCHDDGSGAPI